MGLKDWAKEERPRERMLAHGASTLTDAELLAIVIRSGTQGKTAIDLARAVLKDCGGVDGLFKLSYRAFKAYPGLGLSHYAQLKAVSELTRRVLLSQSKAQPVIASARQTLDFLQLVFKGEDKEVFGVMFLDSQFHLIAFERLFEGTINRASIYPREIIKRALHHNASAMILAHNHPSGNPTPSEQDRHMTHALKQLCENIDIKILDHVVISSGGHAMV